ncbi:MAG: cupredoxin domain-containing protein [Patescibacteria group bacterium]|jgi:cytoskeletal protein RodZ
MDNKVVNNKNQKLWILLGVLAVIVVIIIVAASQGKQGANAPTGADQASDQTSTGTSGQTGTTTAPSAAVTAVDVKSLAPASTTNAVGKEVVSLKGAVVVAPGANPITVDKKVVTSEGKQTDNSAQPMSDSAPKQTGFLNKDTLPTTLINISVGTAFTPNKFTTKAGAPTSFSLTGVDSYSHVIAFDDPVLSAIAILVGPGQTKAITFNAPAKPGTYTFRDASPAQTGKGEMIVQ